jgi:HEAT repeat protein
MTICAALTVLGSLRNDDDHETLVAGLVEPSYFGWVRRGAAAGLGECRTDKARSALIDRLASGKEVCGAC